MHPCPKRGDPLLGAAIGRPHPGTQEQIRHGVSPFRIERYYARTSTPPGTCSRAATASRGRSRAASTRARRTDRLLACWCGYTESPGAPALRRRSPGCTSGRCRGGGRHLVRRGGHFLIHHALLGAGDHAIVETPAMSALSRAQYRGRGEPWRRRHEEAGLMISMRWPRWICPATRLIYLNQRTTPPAR